MERSYFVYIMTNSTRTVLYVGMTNDLFRRVAEHKTHQNKGFTDQYNAIDLLYFEQFNTPQEAIAREKQLKNWSRVKKKFLIDRMNPRWKDQSKEWV
jgi:putative endonuclease